MRMKSITAATVPVIYGREEKNTIPMVPNAKTVIIAPNSATASPAIIWFFLEGIHYN